MLVAESSRNSFDNPSSPIEVGHGASRVELLVSLVRLSSPSA